MGERTRGKSQQPVNVLGGACSIGRTIVELHAGDSSLYQRNRQRQCGAVPGDDFGNDIKKGPLQIRRS